MDTNIAYYEGLILKHSSRVASVVEMDFDDIVQTYRIKVWQALKAFDASRWGGDAATARERFVFSCLKNMEKDLLKRKRRGDLYIEDVAPSRVDDGAGPRDRFDDRYLSADHETTYGEVEEGEVLIPSTLSRRERQIVVLLYGDNTQSEIRRSLGIERSEMDRTMKAIRLKFADWRPSSATPAPVEVPLAIAA